MSKILDLETAKINFDNIAGVVEIESKEKSQHVVIFLPDGSTEKATLPEGKRLKDFRVEITP